MIRQIPSFLGQKKHYYLLGNSVFVSREGVEMNAPGQTTF